jgi:flavin reductase (DIM6/NTAB) family NADH-FMN oxidoreductase RutF
VRAVDAQTRKKTLRMFSNGMYIVTSRSGEYYGAATVTWVSQASFKPLLIMTAIRRESNAFKCLAESRVAAVHVLGLHQQALAAKFFRPTRRTDGHLNGEPFAEGKTSVPILSGTPAFVECSVRQIFDTGGDHAVVILEVVHAECRAEVPPLTIAASPWEYGG